MTELLNPLCAFLGGIAVNLLTLTEMKNIPKTNRPQTFSDWVYDLWFFGIPVIGAGLAWAYQVSSVSLNPILSINIGASAPLILKTLAAAAPNTNPGKVG